MKNVDIIYSWYIGEDNQTITIGGVQTYITDLSKIIVDMGGKVRVVQLAAATPFKISLSENVNVEGFVINEKDPQKRFQKLFDASVKTRNDQAITIFATDTMIPQKVTGRCIAIQHGIFWDIPGSSKRPLAFQVLARAWRSYETVKRLKNVNEVVCVDYNFLNWYRTQVSRIPGRTCVVPNYTRIAPRFDKPDDKVNIIFARRLCYYRGTKVFTEAIIKVLDEGHNISVTVAGDGPDEQWMKEKLGKYDNVEFIYYKSDESLDVHKNKHIAVVPTIGSEGTSLSLLEAMSAQCATICTNVGGMTNIVLNGYNGLVVNAGEVERLYEAIKSLVVDSTLRKTIAEKGYESVKSAFSYEKWYSEWQIILKQYLVD